MNNGNEKLLIFVLFSVIIMFFSCKKDKEKDCKYVQIENKTINVVNITDTTITIQWAAVKNATSYKIGLMKCGLVNYAPNCYEEFITTNNTFILTDLEPNTTYYFTVYAQNECSFETIKTHSATTADGFSNRLYCLAWGNENDDEVFSLTVNSDNSFVAVGKPSNIVKFDEKGNVIWKKTFEYEIAKVIPYFPNSYLIIEDNNTVKNIDEYGNLFKVFKIFAQYPHNLKDICTDINNNIIVVSDVEVPVSNFNTQDIALIKFDFNGNEVYKKIFGTEDGDAVNDIITTNDNSIVVLFTSGINRPNAKAVVIKLNNNGELIWAKELIGGGASGFSAVAIKETYDNGYMAIINIYNKYCYVYKLTADGNCEWANYLYFHASTWAYATDMEVTYDNGCIISGKLLYNNLSTGFAARFAGNGNYLWTKYFVKGNGVRANVIKKHSDSYVVGGTAFIKKPNELNNNYDFFLIKIKDNSQIDNCDCFIQGYTPTSGIFPASFNDINVNFSMLNCEVEQSVIIAPQEVNGSTTIFCE
ncbi:MAG: fibronectin type III domain-containing protein [Bacteroidales bacterium]|nr:fibronectin type III domain-containing protein [Bacteroidales bacterium]